MKFFKNQERVSSTVQILTALALCTALATPALAGKAKTAPPKIAILPDGRLDIDAPGGDPFLRENEFVSATPTTPEELKIAEDESKAKRRNIASSSLASLQSKEFEKFRKEFTAIKTGAGLAVFLDQLKKDYNDYTKYPKEARDVRFVANELIEMIPLRGILFSLIPLVDDHKSNAVHSAILTQVMKFYSQMGIYFPTPHIDAVLEYLTQPFNGVDRFNSVRELQGHVCDTLYWEAFASIARLKAIPMGQPLVWDNTIISGVGGYPDELDRYTLLQSAEKNAILSAKYSGLSSMQMFCAYGLEEVVPLSKEIGKQYGIDGGFLNGLDGNYLGKNDINGVSSRDINAILQKSAYTNLFRLYKDGDAHRRAAIKHLKDAVYFAQQTSTALQGSSLSLESGKQFALNPNLAETIFSNSLTKAVPTWVALTTKDEVEIQSRITGKTITVKFLNFLNNLPTDLKKLLPPKNGGFSTSPQWNPDMSIQLKGETKKSIVHYRNYKYGQAIAWDKTQYSKLFPDLKDGADVANKQRTLMESWGGALVGSPLSFFIR